MPTSIDTIKLALDLYHFFTGKPIEESNLYKFVRLYGNDPLTFERFVYGEPFTERTIDKYGSLTVFIPYSGARFYYFGFIEREFLINYFFKCLNVSPSERLKRDVEDRNMHIHFWEERVYYASMDENAPGNYLSTYPNIEKTVERLQRKGIEFQAVDLFKPFHIRDLFMYIHAEIHGRHD